MVFPLNRIHGLMVAVGEIDRPEFSGLAPYWEQHANSWEIFPTLAALGDWEAEANEVPRVVLLLSARPDQFDPREIVALRRRAPLAQIFSLEGPWCAGAGRTAQLPAGVQRMAWHQWPYRLVRMLQPPSRPPNPVTSTELEQILAQCPLAVSVEEPPSRPTILISAPRLDDFEPIATSCGELGYQGIWYEQTAENPPKAETALWVGASLRATPRRDPADFARQVAPARIVWSLELIQVHDFATVQGGERSTIVSRPGLVEDLRFVLNYPISPAVIDQVPLIPR
ncbi:MAG: hypothetical protein WDZ51_04130 [Pirellulaceae bacterium]